MSFLINGASYTYGDGLENPSEHAWPVLFGKKIGAEILNLATRGASVDYVIYTTMKHLSSNKYDNVIIAWPSLRRTLMVRRDNNFLVNGNPTMTNALYGDTKEFKEYLSLHYRYWSNDLFDLKLTLQKILMFQEYLKSKSDNYLFINSDSYNLSNWLQLTELPINDKIIYLDAFDSMDDVQIAAEESEIENIYNQFDLINYFQPTNFNLTDTCVQLDLLDPITKHPSIQGQKYLADFIADLWSSK